jgi:hypothetical protein
MSWQEEKNRRNTQALARLTKSLPQHLSAWGTRARTQPAIPTANAAAGDRLLLAGTSTSR